MALPYPYIRGNLGRKARTLGRADAVIAVSRYVADRLEPFIPPQRLHTLPNLVDLEEIGRIADQEPVTSLPGPFLLFVGKLELNKGAHELVAALAQIVDRLVPEERLPLLVAGDGSLSCWMQGELDRIAWPARFLQWADHDEVLRLLARTELLLFPSRWEEPLSRVLLEACACATPVLAMATGGTPEIVEDGVSGALVPPTAPPFAQRLLELLRDASERRRLGEGAYGVAQKRFAAPVVTAQLEELYQSLIASMKSAIM
jgi:glycosyltransferase involved in cell wall biosynthesis